jgi:hypothetical protein
MADTPYTSEEVWDMQLECLEQIFEELHQARVAVINAARISQGIYLWGMLKAWQVQQRYVENDFQDDPALPGIFIRRVLLHGQDVSLDECLSKLADGLKKADEHDRQVQSNTKQLQHNVKEMKATIRELKPNSRGGSSGHFGGRKTFPNTFRGGGCRVPSWPLSITFVACYNSE